MGDGIPINLFWRRTDLARLESASRSSTPAKAPSHSGATSVFRRTKRRRSLTSCCKLILQKLGRITGRTFCVYHLGFAYPAV